MVRAPRFHGILFLIFLVALGLRVGVSAQFVGLDAPPDGDSNPDQLDYELFAHRLAEGEGYTLEDGTPTARRPPGTSLALWPAYELFGRNWIAGRLWFALLSALTVWCTGWAASRVFGRNEGLIAAALLAIYPGSFYYAMHFLSEPPFGLALAIFAATSAGVLRSASTTKTWLLGVASGLALAAAVLVRPQAILILPCGGALWLLVRSLRQRRFFGLLVLQGAITAAVLTPWVLRNHREIGKATLSTIGGYTFWGANNALVDGNPNWRGSWIRVNPLIDAEHPVEGSEVQREAATWQYGKDFLREHWQRVPGLLAWKVWRLVSPMRTTPNRMVYWASALSWIFVGPLAALGLLRALRRGRGEHFVLLLPLLATVGTALIFYGSTRFRDAASPMFVVYAAHALALFLPARLRVEGP